jgi:PQQ enzyme repeat/Cytochrome c
MPAFNLPASQLDALATLVHSLNSPAAESVVTGDRLAGEQYFFGKGRCGSCHMVDGKGSPVGPDLSNVERRMTVDEIRESLLQPSAHIVPGYDLVTVRLRDGTIARGFARSCSNFNGKVIWQVPQFGPGGGKRDAGVLATAGGLIFYGDPTGDVVAVDERNGNTLWHFATSGENKASPMTYMVDGKQFVALAVRPNILCFSLP